MGVVWPNVAVAVVVKISRAILFFSPPKLQHLPTPMSSVCIIGGPGAPEKSTQIAKIFCTVYCLKTKTLIIQLNHHHLADSTPQISGCGRENFRRGARFDPPATELGTSYVNSWTRPCRVSRASVTTFSIIALTWSRICC